MAPRMRRRITSAKREEIEKQQEALSHSIMRPFEILSGLPLSYNPPPNGHYEDVLKTPLTTKDSGVLYRSLMKSRLNYMHIGPMFKLYWLKQSSYAKKMQQLDQGKSSSKSQKDEKSFEKAAILGTDVSARDVMVKLCDASLTMGPHAFEIRLFIAKDERSEKNGKKKDERVKEEPKEETISEKIPCSKKADPEHIKVPAQNESADIPQKSTNEIGIPGLKATQTTQKGIDIIDTKVGSTNYNASHGINNDSHDIQTEKISTAKNNSPKKSSKSTIGKQEALINENNVNGKKQDHEIESSSAEKIKNKSDKSQEEPNSDQSKTVTTNTDIKQTTIADAENLPSVSTDTPLQPANGSSSSTEIPSQSANQPISSVQSPLPSTSNTNPQTQSAKDISYMQSVENTIMIANLNTIARVDQSLNALMKIVASGNASPQQIITFQGYISRAREMGPQPHHAYLFPNGRIPSKSKKPPKDKKPTKEKKAPKPKVPRDQKLTAFQEKYLTDATLLFEFVENANVRYMLPKDAICEVLPPANNNDDDDDLDNKDILVSFLWIHNQNEIDEYERQLAAYKDFKKGEEEEMKAKLEESKNEEQKMNANETEEATEVEKSENSTERTKEANEKDVEIDNKNAEDTNNTENTENTEKIEKIENTENKDNTRATRRPPPRKGRKRRGGVPAKNVPKKIECPVEPECKFTSLSFTIHSIPSRYIPIITNSFRPLEKVQESMSHILKSGTRIANFYLWYQIDGKLDEHIAEDLRVQLNQEEKKMQGVSNIPASTNSSTQSVPKKRKLKEKSAEPKPKKVKEQTDILVSSDNQNQNITGANDMNSMPQQHSPDNGGITPTVV